MTFLFQNYPNPFNTLINIKYLLAKAGHVELRIYNLSGQLVKTLVHRQQKAGSHGVEWDGGNDEGKSGKTEINFTVKNNPLPDRKNHGPHHFGAATPIK